MKAIEHLAQLLVDLEVETSCDDLTDYEESNKVCTKICTLTCRHRHHPSKKCWLRWAENMERQDQKKEKEKFYKSL